MNPILLLHGALGSESQLEPLKQKLREAGQDAHTLNFSGHSKSPFKDGFGIEQFADDTLEYMEQNNINQSRVFGYSMGGYVAVWLALNNADRIESIVTLGTKFDWSPESAEKECRKLNPEKIEEKIPAFARILQHRHSPELWKILLHKTAEMMTGLGNQPLLNDRNLSKLQIPVTVCLGDLDDMADRAYSEHVAGVLPNGKFLLFEETPHPIEKVDLHKIISQLM